MENNIEILKLFTRKLANCKYLVPADKLTQYLNEGSFGYSFDESGDKIITNDSVFADEVAQVIEHIRSIFNEPHIILKQEETIRNVSTATEFDVRAFNETIKDEKLWRVKKGEVKPEFVHTYVREENLAIYENRFVCYLLDFLCDSITKKLNVLCENITTFNRKIDEDDNVIAYSQNEYIGYTENVEEIPLLLKKSDPQIVAICSLFKSKTVLNSLKSYEIYKACKKVGFDITSLKPTNILNCDKNYNHCYKFYLSYLLRDNLYLTESQMYSQFALINLMTAITNCGFKLASDSKDIVINNSAELKADCVNFEKGLFRINLSKVNDDFIVTVTELADLSTAKYLFRILTAERKKSIGNSISEYAERLNQETDEYTQIFVITDELENSDQVVYVAAGEALTLKNLEKAIKSITLLVEGVAFINSRYCPVCGTTLIAPDNGDYTCTSCESLYHIFHYENRDLIWIKRLPKKAEKRAKTNDDDEVLHEIIINKETEIKENDVKDNDVAVTKTLEETSTYITRKVIQKSFTGKMSQATKEQIAYYNELKNYLLSFKRVNSRVSWNFDSFNIGRDKAVKIGFRGQTMVAYLALDPAKYVDTKYYPHDMSDKKKFEETPMMVKVKSERGVKNAKELIDVICTELKPVKDFSPTTYKFTRMSDKKLLENGLAKLVEMKQLSPTKIVSKTLQYNPAEEKEEEPIKAEQEVKKATRTSIQKSFTGKMSQATKEQIAYYNELKNYLLSFKGVNSRVSWNFDSFNIGRDQAVKIAFRGKTMVAYFALDPAKYVDTKYYPHDMSDKKKFEETPMMVKVKSERGVKNAKELIDVICTELKPVKDFTPVTYKFTHMSDKKLIEMGLAKQVIVNI